MELTKEFDSCEQAFGIRLNREAAVGADSLIGCEREFESAFESKTNIESNTEISNETTHNRDSTFKSVPEFNNSENLHKKLVANRLTDDNTLTDVASTNVEECTNNNNSTETASGIRLRKREKKIEIAVDGISSDDSEFEKVVKKGRKRKVKASVSFKSNASEKVKRRQAKITTVSEKNDSNKLNRKGKKFKNEPGENEKKNKVKVKSKSSKCQVFFCEKCDKVYDQYSELVYHERRHTGEKPFLCTWPGCKKAFSASNARVRHMRTHTGEKPYVCPLPECGRRFTYWKDLKLHKYRHTGEKPHKCDWEGCSARFFRKDDLKHHRYTHTGEKPYKCVWQGCSAAFSQKSPLNLHVRKTHKNEIVVKNTVSATANCQNTPAFVLLPNYQQQQTLPSMTSTNVQYTQQSVNSNMISNQSQSPFNTSVISVAATADHENPLFLTCRVSPQNIPQTQSISSSFFSALNPWNSQQSYQSVSQEHVALRQLQSNFEVAKCLSSDTSKTSETNSSLQHILSCEQICPRSSFVDTLQLPVISNSETVAKNYARNSKVVEGIIGSISNSNKPKLREVSLGPDSVEFKYLSGTSTKLINAPSVTTATSTTEESETSNKDDNLNTMSIPVRKRANYRLKVQSPDATKISSSISKITTIRKQNRKTTDDSTTKRALKRTIAVQTMKRTIQKNEKGTPHECDICKRKFKAKHDRDCHRMTHTGEKPRACDWPGCDYRCITKSKLIRHKRKHTGERNYPCDWPGCEKKFATSRHMKEHKRSHTGEKPFKCDWPGCDKWFSRKDHIKNHRYTHTGEKPRKCPFPGCESAFIQLSPLKKHMELHKRDGGCVPNRTRKRKAVNTNDESVKSTNHVINNQSIILASDSTVLPSISQHNTALQNFGVINVHDNTNCISGYDASNPQIHLDYETILRPNYC